ncbi:hypothetical protein GCK32_008254 [Trichostrongylus colubriformis]|uniref:Uncharacterized protein n=1 Tax=Trichostrongylus colubriformis TaxID=6319 RepID=A0AAN8EX64_TRICO
MGQRSVYDPHDPWAFRNTWTGEIRNSYDDLEKSVIKAMRSFILKPNNFVANTDCCAHIFPPPATVRLSIADRSGPWCQFYDRLLSVCHTMSWEQRERSRARRRHKSQQIDFEERRDGPSSEPESEVSSPVKHHPRPIHRSYPESFYPRSVTLPPTIHQSERKIYTKNQGRVREPSVPRLKL